MRSVAWHEPRDRPVTPCITSGDAGEEGLRCVFRHARLRPAAVGASRPALFPSGLHLQATHDAHTHVRLPSVAKEDEAMLSLAEPPNCVCRRGVMA